jgi:hypothetical protein
MTEWVRNCRAILRATRLLCPRKLPRQASAIAAVKGRLCCKSRFALMIKNSEGYRRGFRVKMWGTSSPHVKLTGDFGNAIEVIRIGGCFPFRVFAKNS